MLIDKESYVSDWYGYRITDCVVRNKDAFYFIARNEEQGSAAGPTQQETVEKRILIFWLSEPEDKRSSIVTLNRFSRVHAGVSLAPVEQFIGVDASGHVYAIGGGVAEMQGDIPKDGLKKPSISG